MIRDVPQASIRKPRILLSHKTFCSDDCFARKTFLLAWDRSATIFKAFHETFHFSVTRKHFSYFWLLCICIRENWVFSLTASYISIVVVQLSLWARRKLTRTRRENPKWNINIQISTKLNTREKLSIFSLFSFASSVDRSSRVSTGEKKTL